MPAFAFFFPLPVAVAATAIVHFTNNLFKLLLVGKHASRPVTLRFGLPAVPAAFLGALVLGSLTGGEPLWEYDLGGRRYELTSVGIVMGTLIVLFALIDLLPFFDRLRLGPRWLPLGGLLSGVFGGLSGHQGALRAAFLINCGLAKEAFIGTGVVCAVMVDIARLSVYGTTILQTDMAGLDDPQGQGLLIVGTLAAFMGSLLGARYMKKVRLQAVRRLVGVLLLLLGLAIAGGLV